MAYGKLEKYATENETVKTYLNEGMYFEAWITYIREAPKDAQQIADDIDQEVNLKKCSLTDDEKESLQCEAMEYLQNRKYEMGGAIKTLTPILMEA